MGLPALKREASAERVRPHLSTVPAAVKTRSRRTSVRARSDFSPRHRELFRVFAVAALLLAVLGVARIAVTAQAAATSIESAQLRKAIKAERLQGDLLEIQESALATPRRIQEIAGTTMRMSEAGRVCYIQLDGAEVCAPAAGDTASAPGASPGASPEKRAGVVSSVLRAALGEAQLLLLGDVALASSR